MFKIFSAVVVGVLFVGFFGMLFSDFFNALDEMEDFEEDKEIF